MTTIFLNNICLTTSNEEKRPPIDEDHTSPTEEETPQADGAWSETALHLIVKCFSYLSRKPASYIGGLLVIFGHTKQKRRREKDGSAPLMGVTHHRFFPNYFDTSILFEYLLFPIVCVYFYQTTYHSRFWGIVWQCFLYAGAITTP